MSFLIDAEYRVPKSQTEFLNDLYRKLCKYLNQKTGLVLPGDFNLSDMDWEVL